MKGIVIFAVCTMAFLWRIRCEETAGAGAATDGKRQFPARVHVFEDFETEIEKRWWLRGTPEMENLPGSLASIPNTRALRATETHDFDDKMGDPSERYRAVIFNPVPGPPMGAKTRLSFRYWLAGTNSLRVQIYSLSNNYHRRLELDDLSQRQWCSADVDMTTRRPDGSGGPLSKDERIDDIQFYIEPGAVLLIDDIILYEAAGEGEINEFPRRIIFTGWFDTGEQGKEWPGDFEIVLHEKPMTWDAIRAVPNKTTGKPWLRIDMRGERRLGERNALRFRFRLSKPGSLRVVLAYRGSESAVDSVVEYRFESPTPGEWEDAKWEFAFDEPNRPVTEIQIHAPEGAELLVDDVLLYEPAG